jgi:enamine deaminase RidA (YjgF/YER057c/UK114 family)
MTALERLAARGLTLPEPPAPAASYAAWSVSGDYVFTAGQLPLVDGALPRTGVCGQDVTTEQAAELAGTAALNVLAVAAAAADGELDRIRIVKLTVFVASTPEFIEQHLVANGASELLADVLGSHGVHARSAVGVPALSLGSPVEVEAVVELR